MSSKPKQPPAQATHSKSDTAAKTASNAKAPAAGAATLSPPTPCDPAPHHSSIFCVRGEGECDRSEVAALFAPYCSRPEWLQLHSVDESKRYVRMTLQSAEDVRRATADLAGKTVGGLSVETYASAYWGTSLPLGWKD